MEPQFDDIAAELTEWFDSVFDLTQESLFGIAPEGPHRDAVVVDSLIRNARIIYRAELDREGKLYSPLCFFLTAACRRLASFCRKTYKLLINQEKPIIQDQTSDKLERRSGCGFPARRRSGESNCSLPSRSGLVGKLRVAGQRAEPPDWELNRKFSEGSDSGLSR